MSYVTLSELKQVLLKEFDYKEILGGHVFIMPSIHH